MHSRYHEKITTSLEYTKSTYAHRRLPGVRLRVAIFDGTAYGSIEYISATFAIIMASPKISYYCFQRECG